MDLSLQIPTIVKEEGCLNFSYKIKVFIKQFYIKQVQVFVIHTDKYFHSSVLQVCTFPSQKWHIYDFFLQPLPAHQANRARPKLIHQDAERQGCSAEQEGADGEAKI